MTFIVTSVVTHLKICKLADSGGLVKNLDSVLDS